MRVFYQLLINTVLASIANNFIWFALIFWAYIETGSVMTTSLIGGLFHLITGISSFFFGSFVDHHLKKWVMVVSSLISCISFASAGLIYYITPSGSLLNFGSGAFWIFALSILIGAVSDKLRAIAMGTCVTLLVPKDRHDRANGLLGSAMGVTMIVTSILSGLVVGLWGMGTVIALTLIATSCIILHLLMLDIAEVLHPDAQENRRATDIRRTLKKIATVPGLFALILFATINNFLGGVFIALMDAYGLSLMSVQMWGIFFGVCSTAFIIGGIVVSRKGLGTRPLRTLFLCNIITWTICILFTLQRSVPLLALGMYGWMILFPVIEASEQTILQKVVPYEWQGRVFGLGQGIENLVAPISAFAIGPIAEYIVAPFMTTGYGAQMIGSWYGIGPDRGYALIFSVAGMIGLIVTILAFVSRSYKQLDTRYAQTSPV